MPQRETVRKCNLALTNSSLGPHNSPVYSHCRHYLTEPIGATKPNIPRGSEADILSAKSNAALSLACPAQSYPAPGHRCEMLFLSFSSETGVLFSISSIDTVWISQTAFTAWTPTGIMQPNPFIMHCPYCIQSQLDPLCQK